MTSTQPGRRLHPPGWSGVSDGVGVWGCWAPLQKVGVAWPVGWVWVAELQQCHRVAVRGAARAVLTELLEEGGGVQRAVPPPPRELRRFLRHNFDLLPPAEGSAGSCNHRGGVRTGTPPGPPPSPPSADTGGVEPAPSQQPELRTQQAPWAPVSSLRAEDRGQPGAHTNRPHLLPPGPSGPPWPFRMGRSEDAVFSPAQLRCTGLLSFRGSARCREGPGRGAACQAPFP